VADEPFCRGWRVILDGHHTYNWNGSRNYDRDHTDHDDRDHTDNRNPDRDHTDDRNHDRDHTDDRNHDRDHTDNRNHDRDHTDDRNRHHFDDRHPIDDQQCPDEPDVRRFVCRLCDGGSGRQDSVVDLSVCRCSRAGVGPGCSGGTHRRSCASAHRDDGGSSRG
jgi:hypothetical protein